jgi:hypothetical protein
MADEEWGYQAYLLRLWRTNRRGQPVWRASLEDPHTGMQYGFASLAQLVTFLNQRIAGSEPQAEAEDAPPGEFPDERSGWT